MEARATDERPHAAILCIGSELLDGRTVNTNASKLAEQLSSLGFAVSCSIVAGDCESEILEALQFLRERVQLILVTGGLGPTSDDRTREALSLFFAAPLQRIEPELKKLQALYKKRGKRFDPSNVKQATFPEGATIVANPIGTASGFVLSAPGFPCTIALPGVPLELERMYTESVKRELQDRFSVTTQVPAVTFHIFGLPEATVGTKISLIETPALRDINITYRANFPELELRFERVLDPKLRGELNHVIPATLGHEWIYSSAQHTSLPEALHRILSDLAPRVGFVESCTGGLATSLLSAHSGASRYLSGSVVSYSNEAKMVLLGVSQTTLDAHGAVSHETAKEMAEGLRRHLQLDFSVSITGIAGPDGGSAEKPVGTFFIGLSHREFTHTQHFYFPHERCLFQRYAAFSALDTLRRYISGLAFRKDEIVRGQKKFPY